MSWILLCTLVILVICGYAGYRKGIINIVVSIAALLIAIFATAFFSPIAADTIKKNTKIYDNICDYMYRVVSDNETMNDAINDTVDENADVQINEGQIEQYEQTINDYLDKINGVINLPDEYSQKLSGIGSNEYFKEILSGDSTVKNIVVRAFAIRVSDLIFQTTIYILLFIIIYIALRIVVFATGIIAHLPVIHGANKLLGLGFGIVEGLILIWILYIIITAMSGSEFATTALIDINSNSFLKLIYDNNMIMKLVFRT